MSSLLLRPFALRGEFVGFVRTVEGKRRMVLRADGEEYFLKVPKELRHHLTSTLSPGSSIAVTGDQVLDRGEASPKRVVATVQLLTPSGAVVPIHCPIRVCTKKNCWRSGGKQLWHALEETLAQRGLAESIVLEGVDCMDYCKQAPNVEWEGRTFHRCSPEDAEKIVDAVSGKVERSAEHC